METDEDSSGALGAGEHGGNAQKTGQCAETFGGELAVAAWGGHGPVPWRGRASGKSSDFPGLNGNPLPVVHF